MYNGKVTVPILVRTPMGGKRGYGPTHSQSLEKHLLGLPGTRVLALHSRFDPGVTYDTIFASIDRPTIVIENKALYGLRLTSQVADGFVLEHSDEPFPTTRIRPAGTPDLTLLCYGGMLPDAEKAVEQLFDGEEIVVEVLCPTQLYPLNPWPIIESVRQSGRLLVVEEGLSFAAFGAETMAQILESAPDALRRAARVGPPRHPIPACGPLEKAILPGTAQIVAAAKELLRR
jgi:2-oxoisovalerate dehydrogenase E1 component